MFSFFQENIWKEGGQPYVHKKPYLLFSHIKFSFYYFCFEIFLFKM